MTGKELIMFILTNNLEDEELIVDGKFVGFMNEEEAAVKFEVGISTIKMWHNLGMIKGFKVCDTLYIPKNAIVEPVAK